MFFPNYFQNENNCTALYVVAEEGMQHRVWVWGKYGPAFRFNHRTDLSESKIKIVRESPERAWSVVHSSGQPKSTKIANWRKIRVSAYKSIADCDVCWFRSGFNCHRNLKSKLARCGGDVLNVTIKKSNASSFVVHYPFWIALVHYDTGSITMRFT